MTACMDEELTPSLLFSIAGTGRWHSPHYGPIRRPCSGARSCLVGVGGAYGGMGSKHDRHALVASHLIGEQDPGHQVRVATVCARGRGGCRVSAPWLDRSGRWPFCADATICSGS